MNHISSHAQTSKSPRNTDQNAPRTAGKTEMIDGRTVQKPPASRWHNIIRSNFVTAIGGRMSRANCEIYAADMQVQVAKNSLQFPDVVVVNGSPNFSDRQSVTLTNPTAVIEIFSPTEHSIDRTHRIEGFLAIPSIKECLLVNENEMRVEHYARQQVKQWVYRIYNERDDIIVLDSLQVRLSLTEVYTQVKFGESELSSKTVH